MNREIIELREVVQKLVPLLAGKGLTVTQRGSQAYVSTNPVTKKPETVNIPNISDNATPEFMRAIQGFIDHEVAHVLITDWNYYGRAPSAKDLRKVSVQRFLNTHNIVEDTMIEREMVKIFPGSEKNISDLRRYFLSKVTDVALKKAKTEKEKFIYLLVPTMRALAGHVEMQEWMDAHGYWKNKYVDGVVTGLKPATLDLLKRCTSTKETLEISEELHLLLYPPAPAPKEEDPAPAKPAAPPPPPKPPAPKPATPPKEEDPEEGDDGEDEDDGKAGSKSKPKPTKDPEPEEDEDDDIDLDEGDEDEDEDAPPAGAGSGTDPREHEEDGDDDSEDEGDAPGEDEDDTAGGSSAAGGDPDEDSGDDDDDTSAGDEDEDLDSDEDDDDMFGGGLGVGDDEGLGGHGYGDDDEDEGEERGESGADREEGGRSPFRTEGADGGGVGSIDHEDHENKGNGSGGGVGNEGAKSIFDFDDDAFDEADMSSQIGILISKDAVLAMDPRQYTVFSRELDQIEPIVPPENMNSKWVPNMEDEVRSMTGRMQKDIERLMASQSHVVRTPGHRNGKLHAPSLYRVTQGDPRVFSQRQEHVSKDTAVTLLCDNSGSMGGQKMKLAMTAAYALHCTLERVRIAHEVLGFTSGGYYDTPHTIREAMERDRKKSGINYDRVEPIIMPIYKDFDERSSATVKARFAYMMNAQYGLNGNIDGESLEYAALRLARRPEKRKVMLVLSDGQPAGSHKSGPHLAYMVQNLEKNGIETVGIGIMDASVARYYPKHVVLKDVSQLPTEVMAEIKRILR